MVKTAPPTFYKYYPVEDWLPLLLAGESLKFSSRTSFNDPFDSRPAFQVSATSDAGKAYIHQNLKRANLSPAQRVVAAARVRAQSVKARAFAGNGLEQILDDIGILSLGTTWRNVLLWSHYADHHKGICIGFKSNIDVFATALPVEYQIELPVIRRPDDGQEVMLQKTFLTKAECWAYEDEWRIIKRKLTIAEQQAELLSHAYLSSEHRRVVADQRGHGIYTVRQGAIDSITLGMRISDADQKAVLSWIAEAGLKVPVYKVAPPATNYTIVRRTVR